VTGNTQPNAVGSAVHDHGASHARCAVCGVSYEHGAWTALPLVGSVSPSGVRMHLSVPAEWSVEVRRCSCGAELARRRS
jgi:hypothetical protein